MDGSLRRLGAGHFKSETRQRLGRHQWREPLRQLDTQWMFPLKAVAALRLVHRLDNFRVAVTQRIGRPAVLEVDVLLAVHIPDIIALGAVHDNLGGRFEAPGGTVLTGSLIPQAIAQMWQATRQQGSCFRSRDLIGHEENTTVLLARTITRSSR